MPKRKEPLINGQIYHVFNRGVEKRKVFLTARDYNRFLEAFSHYSSNKLKFSTKSKLSPKRLELKELESVEVLGYCFMPNHFHFLLRQKTDDGLSKFVGDLLNSYTKYFNIKNDRVGPLFQGRFRAVLIDNDEQLVHVSRYIHLNPLIANLVSDIESYPWSSYRDYLGLGNNTFVKTAEILDLFKSKEDYKQFVLDQVDYARVLDQFKHKFLD